MKKIIAISIVLFISAPSFGQSLKRLDAAGATTPTAGGGTLRTGPLSVAFNDVNGDGLVQTEEFIYMRRMSVIVNNFADVYIYNNLVGTPEIDGVSTSSGVDADGVPCCWWFTGPQVAEPTGIDGWFPSRWEDYGISDIPIPTCDAPVTIEEVIEGLEGGFDVDPSDPNTFTPIWNASTGTSTRGFIDFEEPELYSIQCEEDHFALYVWIGAGDPDTEDALQVVSDFRDSLQLTLTIDGSPVGVTDFGPYIGVIPSSISGRRAGIIKVAGIVEPGDLSVGPHVAEMALSQGGFDLGTFRAGFYIVASSPEAIISNLIDEIQQLNVNAGILNALDSKLQNAIGALDLAQAGDTPAAVQMLEAFINSVEAQIGKALTPEQGATLISAAQSAIARIQTV